MRRRLWAVALTAALATPGSNAAGDADLNTADPSTASLSVAGLWRIDQARIEPIIDRRHARLDFGPDGRLTGHTSCNDISARYTLDGAALTIAAIETTHHDCRPLLLEQEDRILSALEAAVTARVRPDGLLELRDADGRGVLRGTRFEP